MFGQKSSATEVGDKELSAKENEVRQSLSPDEIEQRMQEVIKTEAKRVGRPPQEVFIGL